MLTGFSQGSLLSHSTYSTYSMNLWFGGQILPESSYRLKFCIWLYGYRSPKPVLRSFRRFRMDLRHPNIKKISVLGFFYNSETCFENQCVSFPSCPISRSWAGIGFCRAGWGNKSGRRSSITRLLASDLWSRLFTWCGLAVWRLSCELASHHRSSQQAKLDDIGRKPCRCWLRETPSLTL